MAAYNEDFSGGTPGSPASGWTERWATTDPVWTVETGGDDQILKCTITTGTQVTACSRNDVDSDADRDDVEILAKFLVKSVGVATTQGGVIARASGGTTTKYGYSANIYDNDLIVHKYVNNTGTTIATSAKSLTINTWYWLRFRVNGTSLQARIWADGGSEPGSWDIDTTDSAISAAGWVGARGANPSADPEFDVIAIATNGDTASVGAANTVSPGAGGVAVAGQAPTISQPHTVSPAAGAVSVAGYAPSLTQGVSVAPGVGSVAYTGQAPSIAQPHTVAPSAGAVTVLGYAPAIQQAAGIYPGAGEVVYTGQTPTVSQPHTVAPGFGAYDILGYAPTVSQAAGVAPLAGSIIILGYAPSIAQPHTVAPGAGAAAWLGYEPTISQIASSFTEAQLQEILAYVEANMTVPTANEIATAVWQMVLEGALTAEQIMRIKLAALAGKRQGLGTATEEYLAQDGVTPRVTFTPSDAAGNGTTVVDGS